MKKPSKQLNPSEDLRHAAVLATADPTSNPFWEQVAEELENLERKPGRVRVRQAAKNG